MGGETHNPFTPALDATIEARMKEWNVPGMSIAVTSYGHVSSKGYGLADVETVRPAEPETLYYVASITKHMFAAAFVRHLEADQEPSANRITLQTPISEVIRDDFVIDTPHTTATTTFEDALSHRTGLGRYDATYGKGELKSVRNITRHVRHLALSAPPRTKFIYNNIMYMVASHALETLTGESFSQHLHSKIFNPLEMKHTFATLHEARDGSEGSYQLATPYAWMAGKLVKREYNDGFFVAGAGALISSVSDWAKWLNVLLEQKGPVTPHVWREISQARTICDNEDSNPWDNLVTYCLGLERYSYRGVEIFAHTGGHVGFTGQMIIIPSLHWAAIMFCNGEAQVGYALTVIAYRLVDDLLDVPERERKDSNKTFHRIVEEEEEKFLNSQERIYPDICTPLLPPLRLAEYVGTYRSPVFGDLTFHSLKCSQNDIGTLEAVDRNRTWPLKLTLEHVTGDFWLGRCLDFLRYGFKAQFELSPSGKVARLGMALESAQEEKMWWFEKIAG